MSLFQNEEESVFTVFMGSCCFAISLLIPEIVHPISSETQGQIVGRRKVGKDEKKVGIYLAHCFFRPFRLSLVPATICPWVSEDEPFLSLRSRIPRTISKQESLNTRMLEKETVQVQMYVGTRDMFMSLVICSWYHMTLVQDVTNTGLKQQKKTTYCKHILFCELIRISTNLKKRGVVFIAVTYFYKGRVLTANPWNYKFYHNLKCSSQK